MCDIMTGVSGEIASEKVNKNTRISLNFDWESYKYLLNETPNKKYSGNLPGDGETYFMIEKETLPDKDYQNYETIYSKVYEGGGDCVFENRLDEVPKEVLNAWKDILLKYKKNENKH